MTPKQKAEELFSKYSYLSKNHVPTLGIKVAKECALVALDEIIPIVEGYEDALSLSQQSDTLEWWQQVKQEIQKL